MEEKLIVTLDGNGGIEVETEGFTGKVCDKVADEIVVKMGATVTQEKKKPEYLRLDVTDYKDYISLMAEHTSNTSGKYVSMTQYILRLIEADKQKNLETYEKLEQIERMKRELM